MTDLPSNLSESTEDELRVIQSSRLDTGAMCPSCGYGPLAGMTKVSDGAQSEESPLPEEGQLGLCWRCGHILRYSYPDGRLAVHSASEQELRQVPAVELVLLKSLSRRLKERNNGVV